MRAELRGLDSYDHDLRSYVPETDAFCVSINAEIGSVCGKGADLFSFDVCSPKWLEGALGGDLVVSGRHKLFMSAFNYAALEAYVLKRVRQAEGPDWQSVAEQLARWAHWEFEDYRES